jgi:8-oxo-dGTP pyrophosphatase MutT (NUDIX family)
MSGFPATLPDGEVSAAIPAATVVLLRDGAAGIEALLVRRNSKLEFAGGMWVFPGGRLDGDDFSPPFDPDAAAAAIAAHDAADPTHGEWYLPAARAAARRGHRGSRPGRRRDELCGSRTDATRCP